MTQPPTARELIEAAKLCLAGQPKREFMQGALEAASAIREALPVSRAARGVR